MEVIFAVKHLLRTHDCVIIPGLGGFIAKYSDAKIDLNNYELSPPSKIIAFNSKLDTNDKLLTSFISNYNKISVEEADIIVKSFITELFKEIITKKTYRFGDLGEFVLKNDSLLFKFYDDINLLNSSFGLSKFNFPVIKKDEDIIRGQQNRTIHTTKSKKNNQKIYWTLSAAAVFIGLLFLSLYFFNFSFNEKFHTATLAPFNVFNENHSFSPETAVKKIINKKKAHKKIILKDDNIIDLIDTEQIKQTETQNFLSEIYRNHIIAGSFSEEKNAFKLKNQLNQAGYNSQIFPAPNGMFRVSVKSFKTRKEAIEELQILCVELNNEELWIFFSS